MMKTLLLIVLLATGCASGTSLEEAAPDISDREVQLAAPTPKPWWHDSLVSMTQDAALVITGQVISQKAYSARADWLPRALIVTTVTVKVDRVLKGKGPETVHIDVIGGCLEGTCLDKSHESTFEDGERDILFLTERDVGKFGIIHGESGKICLDGRYIRRNAETIEIPEDELLSVVANAAGKAVQR